METLRARWRREQTSLGAWLSIPSVVSAEATARAGFDYACIDAQHGVIDYADAVVMIQAVLAGGVSPIVRAPWNEAGSIGKLLDAGAHGVIVPMVNTAAQAEAVVQACRYPPRGARSYGPTLARPRHPDDYLAWAAEHVAVLPMIETVEALANLDEILDVDGIDGVYVGPADLSLSLGLAPGNHDDEPAFVAAIEAVVAGCRRRGLVPGIHANASLGPRRLEAGFAMVTVASDLETIRAGCHAALSAARTAPESPR